MCAAGGIPGESSERRNVRMSERRNADTAGGTLSKEGTPEVRVLRSDWPIQISAFATGDDPLGRGDRGPIPLHLILETTQNLTFAPGAPQRWGTEFSILGDTHF